MLKLAVPAPVPVPADDNEIHGTVLAALQAQPGPVVTVTVSASPPAPAVKAPGATLKVQLARDWTMLKRSPAAVIVALRVWPPAAATSN